MQGPFRCEHFYTVRRLRQVLAVFSATLFAVLSLVGVVFGYNWQVVILTVGLAVAVPVGVWESATLFMGPASFSFDVDGIVLVAPPERDGSLLHIPWSHVLGYRLWNRGAVIVYKQSLSDTWERELQVPTNIFAMMRPLMKTEAPTEGLVREVGKAN